MNSFTELDVSVHFEKTSVSLTEKNTGRDTSALKTSSLSGDTIYEFDEHPILDRQKKYESNARSYPRRIPIVLKRAQGVWVEDVEGRIYIDCLAGAGTLALGHNHPAIAQAVRNVLELEVPLHTLDLMTPVKDKFMQDILDILPADFSSNTKIQFCSPSGTDAIEAAIKLARTATERNNILAFHGAYHGMSQGSLSLMGDKSTKNSLSGLLNGVQFLPFPNSYRCPFGLGGEAGVNANLHYIETVLSDTHSGIPTPAAVIVEAIQGEGGVMVAPVKWLRGLREITQRAGVPLIIDEVQTGFGRTGRNFAFELAGIVPDMVVLSKAIGGGLPMSVVVYKDELDRWEPGAHAGTFRGNQMAMAAGSVVMDFLKTYDLANHAAKMGARLAEHLYALKDRYHFIGDVRGSGLMLGAEIIHSDGTLDELSFPKADRQLAAKIQSECLKRGLIIELGGRHSAVLRFLPPLIVNVEQIDRIAQIVEKAIQACMDT